MMLNFVKRMSPDRRRAVVVGLIVIGAFVGKWLKATEDQEKEKEKEKEKERCWLPGFPRYPNARLESVTHDQKRWHATLDTPDSDEQVASYYSAQLASVKKRHEEPIGRHHFIQLRGTHPAGSYIAVSIMEDHPEKSEWALAQKIDLQTRVRIFVAPPSHASNDANWPFGPDHPAHEGLWERMGGYLGELFDDRLDGDDSKR
jgi:hypothetical protein